MFGSRINSQRISALSAAVAVYVIPAVALATGRGHGSHGGGGGFFSKIKGFFDWFLSLIFGPPAGGGQGSTGSTGVPELGGEGLLAVAVVLLAGVALLVDRRRRAARTQAI